MQPFLTKWFPSLRTLIRSSPDMDSMVSVLDPAWNEVLPTSYVVDRTRPGGGAASGRQVAPPSSRRQSCRCSAKP